MWRLQQLPVSGGSSVLLRKARFGHRHAFEGPGGTQFSDGLGDLLKGCSLREICVVVAAGETTCLRVPL